MRTHFPGPIKSTVSLFGLTGSRSVVFPKHVVFWLVGEQVDQVRQVLKSGQTGFTSLNTQS